MSNQDVRMALLSRVASLYYDKKKTQQEIADLTGIGRPIISKMINEAREKGVVKITVQYPWTSKSLEKALIETFDLKDSLVMVTDFETYDELLNGLGTLVAGYFTQILHDDMVIGISWGSALQHMINALQPRPLSNIEVVQIIGASGTENNPTEGPLLAQLLSERLSASCRYLHAPLVVENKVIHDGLLQERTIRDTLNRARQANVALVGIGSVDRELFPLMRSGYMSESERLKLVADGAVGDICGQYYSIDGKWLDTEINHRIIGIDLQTLAQIETVIAVAGDIRKGDAILGALRGGYVDVLATDARTAQYLLDHA
ncbi:MAG: sugar-binding transcriptional regulator [Leptolinea sp.]|jgi:DNA-binding transcriptional regulator LsrR (DeoR family)|nr:sugar-binding transcriptional regulator [Leptolinea sp.]